MLEKMFTTKMSADKKKLQSRFSKIRSENGKLSKLFGSILFGIIIIAIISAGVIIAVNSPQDYRMTDDEFSDYINRPIGSIMADLDYVDDEKLVFHYLEGFFVIDQQSYEITHKINLGKLNIAGHTQGDCFTVFKIDKNGDFAYLINEGHSESVGKYDNYIINLTTGEVRKGNMPDGTEIFANYFGSGTVKDSEGWVSTGIIEREGKTYYLTVKDSVIGAIQLATVYDNVGNEVEKRYVFGDSYVSLSQQKADLINKSLAENEEILVNSGSNWEVNKDTLKLVFDKISKAKQIKHIDIEEGNYDIIIYHISNRGETFPRLYVIDNYNMELLYSFSLSKEEYFEINKLIYEKNGQKNRIFLPDHIKDISDAEVVVKEKTYPILDRNDLKKIEQTLSGAKQIKGGTGCSFTASMIITRKDGEKGEITLTTDGCTVFKSGDTYYDYSGGDNSEMLGYFGLDAETILKNLEMAE